MNVSDTFPPINEMPTMAFSWFDYTFFCGMLGLSIIIGIYFGFFNKQDTTEEYLLGGKSMKILPVAMSLVARYNFQVIYFLNSNSVQILFVFTVIYPE